METLQGFKRETDKKVERLQRKRTNEHERCLNCNNLSLPLGFRHLEPSFHSSPDAKKTQLSHSCYKNK